jgi:hypothetical protein
MFLPHVGITNVVLSLIFHELVVCYCFWHRIKAYPVWEKTDTLICNFFGKRKSSPWRPARLMGLSHASGPGTPSSLPLDCSICFAILC